MDRVAEVQPWFSGDAVVILKTGAKLRLSRSYRDAFHCRLFGKQRDE
jgi:DNA-binding LytR/AlgR family response regulator